jgi:hypothetical protein
MPVAAQKVGSMKNLKKQLKKGGVSIIKYVPKNDSMTVRFLTEPEEFVGYWEHYDEGMRKSFPCTGEDACPGCMADERKSFIYLANAVDTNDDKVIPFQIKKSVMNTLTIKYEKYGTLMDRDYEVARFGEGLDTTYDVSPEAPKRMNVTKYQLLDLTVILQAAYDSVFDDDAADDADDDDDEPVARKKKVSKAGPPQRRKRGEEPFPDDDDDDDEDEDEDEPDADEEDDEPDDEEMQAMDWADLKEYARSIGVKLVTKKRSELIRAINKKRG